MCKLITHVHTLAFSFANIICVNCINIFSLLYSTVLCIICVPLYYVLFLLEEIKNYYYYYARSICELNTIVCFSTKIVYGAKQNLATAKCI